jgi:hypothetical protein
MKNQPIELTYSVVDYIENEYKVLLNKVVPEQSINQPKADISFITQSYARLYSDYNEVGKIYYYSNEISQTFPLVTNKNFSNVVIELYPSPCFDSNTFVSGQLFYGIATNVFENNKKYSFRGLSTGGSFADKNVKVNIYTNDTPIRKVTINVKDFNCECNNN